jgi:CheY-like chemotaxis protein
MAERCWTKGPVLVVEDHADSRQMICDLLEACRIPCVTAHNGLAALQALHEHRPSLILLDLWMPDVDGIDFRRLQLALSDSDLARVPVVVLTALPDHQDHVSALGAIAGLQKPVLIDDLLTLVWQIGSAKTERT